jgi:hypothetical protein
MIAHRPTYIVMKELPSKLYRFTTNLKDYAVAGTESDPGCEDVLLCDTDTVDFWNYYNKYDNPQAISLLRFHLVVVHPGDTHTWHDGYTSWSEDSPYTANDATVPTLTDLKTGVDKCCWDNVVLNSDGSGTYASCDGVANPDADDHCGEMAEDGVTKWYYSSGFELWYDGVDDFGEWAEITGDYSNVVVFNMRTKSVTHRIPLETCGDGIKNDETTWFEECERNYKFTDECATNSLYLDGVLQGRDSNNYCPGEYLYECGNGGISDYCYFNEETGTDPRTD